MVLTVCVYLCIVAPQNYIRRSTDTRTSRHHWLLGEVINHRYFPREILACFRVAEEHMGGMQHTPGTG
uniref:Uncharacterized protein n=1 Tax=Anguilla anguilla TaxID=7936 RepID=A0A0E9Q9A6_ANGAN